MRMLEKRDRDTIAKLFADAGRPVRIAVLDRGDGGTEFGQVLDDLRTVVPSLEIERHVWSQADEALAEQAPAIVLLDAEGRPTGARFLGYPTGYEFAAFIHDLADLAHGRNELSAATTETLAQLSQDVHIKVFTTPT